MSLSKTFQIRRHNEDVLSRSKEGDLLEFPRGKYSHWAVYTGNQRVIHLTGDNDGISDDLSNPRIVGSPCGVQSGKAEVREDKFWDVARDSKVRINNYRDKDRVVPSGTEIVRRARSKLGEVGYNVLWKNCEHFATWCRYGEGISEQVWNFVTNMLAAFAAILGTLLVVSRRKQRQ